MITLLQYLVKRCLHSKSDSLSIAMKPAVVLNQNPGSIQPEVMRYSKCSSRSFLCSKLHLNFTTLVSQTEALYLQLGHPRKGEDIALWMSLLHSAHQCRQVI